MPPGGEVRGLRRRQSRASTKTACTARTGNQPARPSRFSRGSSKLLYDKITRSAGSTFFFDSQPAFRSVQWRERGPVDGTHQTKGGAPSACSEQIRWLPVGGGRRCHVGQNADNAPIIGRDGLYRGARGEEMRSVCVVPSRKDDKSSERRTTENPNPRKRTHVFPHLAACLGNYVRERARTAVGGWNAVSHLGRLPLASAHRR